MTLTIIRSTLFIIWFSLVTAVLAIAFLPAFLVPRVVVMHMARWWVGLNFWGLKVFAGLGFEVRGTPPGKGVLVALKHMSMWETMAIYYLLDDPAIVLKRSLTNVPFYGWYLRKARMIAIDREGGAHALRAMAAKARVQLDAGRAIAIFPEGTRVKPHRAPDYKPGVAALYTQLNVPCVPVALNSGLFWTGPVGYLKKKGTIVIEFLPTIPPGVPRREFMSRLQSDIETATNKLIAEGEAMLAAEGLLFPAQAS
ncbi:MAG: 1-acyl-sn-glycerol-3-phosphate acyltransferase [Alphaproteobacteria bacterium]|nr:1-acyl-sn-glycerol-3-phosphate acyltransferase [Alphaproteobacteria bacterium]MBL6937474.1 1-acyl-sn-glycerol-3-phosphate acyltransferase [Alphaproteobacteria bacterium]MBL7098812.1 1-acyl-sn-glycerol-3-phosphate acyltransferase [Alphaproteobacteria bacterium]